MAVCSTSNEKAVSTIVRVMLGPEIAAKMRIFAGGWLRRPCYADQHNTACSSSNNCSRGGGEVQLA